MPCPVDENHQVTYSTRYDSYVCDQCNTWLDGTCEDPECMFCKDRPATPHEEDTMNTPNPGSDAAIAQGCTCPVMDNHHGAGMPFPDGPRFWINADCPLHSQYLKKEATDAT